MKKLLMIAALLLALSILTLVFASCGNDGEKTSTTQAPASATQETEQPTQIEAGGNGSPEEIDWNDGQDG